MLNLAAIHEAIAAVIPERECLVFRERRLTWAQVTDRTRRLASVLRRARARLHARARGAARTGNPGRPTSRSTLQRQRVSRGHARRVQGARVPFNVNYRYVEEELALSLRQRRCARRDLPRELRADARAHPRASPERRALAAGRRRLGRAAAAGRARLRGRRSRTRVPHRRLPTSRPTISTSSTPAARRACRRACSGGRRTSSRAALCTGDRRRRSRTSSSARSAGGIRALPGAAVHARRGALGGVQHAGTSAARWSCSRQTRRLDPHDVWSTVEREKRQRDHDRRRRLRAPARSTSSRKRRYDLSSLKLFTSGGAILTAALKQELLELTPGVRILDALGSSESGAQAVQFSRRATRATTGDFALTPGQRRAEARISRRCFRAGRGAGLARAPRPACRSATTRTRRRPRAPSRSSAACATPCPATARGIDATGSCASSGATRSRSTRAARRSSPRRSSTR